MDFPSPNLSSQSAFDYGQHRAGTSSAVHTPPPVSDEAGLRSRQNVQRPRAAEHNRRRSIEAQMAEKHTNRTLGVPVPCELRGGHIAAEVNDAIAAGDSAAVIYRFLQTAKEARDYRGATVAECGMTIAAVTAAYMLSGSARIIWTVLSGEGVGVATIHGRLAAQFSELHAGCRQKLREDFGEEFVRQLDTLKFDEDGILAASSLLRNENLYADPTYLFKKYLEKLEDNRTPLPKYLQPVGLCVDKYLECMAYVEGRMRAMINRDDQR
jgi:hypothetical protein